MTYKINIHTISDKKINIDIALKYYIGYIRINILDLKKQKIIKFTMYIVNCSLYPHITMRFSYLSHDYLSHDYLSHDYLSHVYLSHR